MLADRIPSVKTTAPSAANMREAALTYLESEQGNSRVLSVTLYKARVEEPSTAVHEIVNGLLVDRFPGAALSYQDVLSVFRDPLLVIPDPTTADHWLLKGRVLQEEGQWCGGLACYNKAIEFDPRRADVWCAKGNVLLLFARAALGLSAVDVVRGDTHPGLAPQHARAAVDSAIACCDRALSVDSKHEDTVRLRGVCAGLLSGLSFEPVLQFDRPEPSMETGPESYLAALRAKKENLRLRPVDQAELERVYKDRPEQLALARTRPLGGRDDSMLQGILADLVAGMPEEVRLCVAAQVAAGEILSKEANACISKATTPFTGYALFVTRGWRTLLNSIGRALLLAAETTPGTFTGNAPFVADGSDEQAQLHFNCLYAQLRGRNLPFIPAERLALSDDKAFFLRLLEVYAVAFTLGHELGHLILGHLESPASCAQEFAADRAGFTILLNWLCKRLPTGELQDQHVEAAVAGAELVFAGMSMIEASREGSGTHPPMPDRFNLLRETFPLPDAAYALPNMMMRRTLELRNRAIREYRKSDA